MCYNSKITIINYRIIATDHIYKKAIGKKAYDCFQLSYGIFLILSSRNLKRIYKVETYMDNIYKIRHLIVQ